MLNNLRAPKKYVQFAVSINVQNTLRFHNALDRLFHLRHTLTYKKIGEQRVPVRASTIPT